MVQIGSVARRCFDRRETFFMKVVPSFTTDGSDELICQSALCAEEAFFMEVVVVLATFGASNHSGVCSVRKC